MENPNEGQYNMPKNDWQNDDQITNEDANVMPGTAGNISSPTDQYTGSEYQASDRQDDPGNAEENDTDSEEETEDADTDEDDDSLHKSDWGDVDPQHGGSSSNEPSFPGSAI